MVIYHFYLALLRFTFYCCCCACCIFSLLADLFIFCCNVSTLYYFIVYCCISFLPDISSSYLFDWTFPYLIVITVVFNHILYILQSCMNVNWVQCCKWFLKKLFSDYYCWSHLCQIWRPSHYQRCRLHQARTDNSNNSITTIIISTKYCTVDCIEM